MKRTILSFLVIFTFLSSSLVLKSQDVLLNSDFVHFNFEGIDLANEFDLSDYIEVTNNTDEVIELKWERIVVTANTESEWRSQICDNNLCYGFNVDTNYDPDNNIDAPFILQPGETFAEFALHVWPEMTPGCGQYKIRFSRTSAPDEILAVAHIDVSVNTPGCMFLSSTREQEQLAEVALYPNPTFGQFTMTNNDVVKNLAIYSILGKQMKQVRYNSGDYVDISDLADGLYLVALQNDEGHTMKTLRLSKRSIHP